MLVKALIIYYPRINALGDFLPKEKVRVELVATKNKEAIVSYRCVQKTIFIASHSLI